METQNNFLFIFITFFIGIIFAGKNNDYNSYSMSTSGTDSFNLNETCNCSNIDFDVINAWKDKRRKRRKRNKNSLVSIHSLFVILCI